MLASSDSSDSASLPARAVTNEEMLALEPRVEFGIHHVLSPSAASVLIIRVKESLLMPHRVVFQGKPGEFWARSSAGKFSMDTDELRQAFTLSDSIYERIRAFRESRVEQVIAGETPIPLMPNGKVILHLIPVSSFRSRQVFDVASMPQLSTQFPPMATSSWDHRRSQTRWRLHVRHQRSMTNRWPRSFPIYPRRGTFTISLREPSATNRPIASHRQSLPSNALAECSIWSKRGIPRSKSSCRGAAHHVGGDC